MQAFLALIRYPEGNKQDRPDAYHRRNQSPNFSSLKTHPGPATDQEKSSASGAYQIIWRNDKIAVDRGIVHDLSERSQDKIAIWLINDKGALWLIQDAKLDAAFAALNQIWSSLPGGGESHLTADEAKNCFWSKLGEKRP